MCQGDGRNGAWQDTTGWRALLGNALLQAVGYRLTPGGSCACYLNNICYKKTLQKEYKKKL